MDVGKALLWATNKLRNKSRSPGLDAEVLLSQILKKDKAWLFANANNNLTIKQLNKFRNLIRKRANHWPVAYLTGHKEFFGLDFKVNPDVLIPRPETELLVELALNRISNRESRIENIIDVGTGSGCIVIAIAKNVKNQNIKFYATDVSNAVLKIAKQNAKRHGVGKKIKFFKGNLLGPILNSKFDIRDSLIIANLPYGWNQWKNNTSADTAGLKFEPQRALFTKESGLYHIRRLFEQAAKFKIRNSTLLIEFDPRQKQKLLSLTKKYFPKAKFKFHRDLSTKFRVLEISNS